MTAPALKIYISGTTNDPVSGDNLNTFEQTCDTVSQLRAFIGTAGMQVFIRGLTAVGDGGQGVFYWVSTGALIDNGVTVIVPPGAATGGGWLRATYGDALQSVRVVTVAGAVTVSPADGLIVIRKTAPATTTVTLPASPVLGETHGVKDGSGNAPTYNITIAGNGHNVDAASTFVLTLPYQETWFTYDGTQWSIGPAYNSLPVLLSFFITAPPSVYQATSIGNAIPSLSVGAITTTTGSATSWENGLSVQLVNNLGLGATEPASANKVAGYFAIRTDVGGGNAWAINPLLYISPGAGLLGGQQIAEFDMANYSGYNYGDAITDVAQPAAYGMQITGISANRVTAAIGIFGNLPGNAPMWNRGIVASNNSINLAFLQDFSNAATSYDLRGTHNIGIDLRNSSCSDAAMIFANSQSVQAENFTGTGNIVLIQSNVSNEVYLGSSGVPFVVSAADQGFIPAADNAQSLGFPGFRWSVVYAATGTINTSAARLKQDIVPLRTGMLDVVIGLQPKEYRWIDGGGHPGKRQHFGFLAGDVKAAVSDHFAVDFAGYVANTDATWEGLRMDQLTPILWKAQQEFITEMRGEVAALQQQVAALAAGAKP